MFVLDTDASVVAISSILHHEQDWNGKTVLRPIAYGSKVLSSYFCVKVQSLLRVPFKLRVDNQALARLIIYSMDKIYISCWIVRLVGYHTIIENRTRDIHQKADSLSKKTEFYERNKITRQRLRMVFLF